MMMAKKVLAYCGVVFLLVSISITLQPALSSAASKEIIAAAIKEGELTWLDGMCLPESAKVLIEAFKKEYGLPDTFKVKHERLGTGPLSTRVAEEVKANRFTIDVFAAAVPTLYADLKEHGALLRYDSPEYAHFTRSRTVGLSNEPGYWQSAFAYAFAPLTNPKIYPRRLPAGTIFWIRP